MVEEKIVRLKQEREILSTLNGISNLEEYLSECHKLLSMDIPLCEKTEIINDFRKNLPSHLNGLQIKSDVLTNNYRRSRGDSYRVGKGEGKSECKGEGKGENNLLRPQNNSNIPSLWISGFSENTSQRDLLTLFPPLDPKLTQDLVVHRGHYAFINFRDPHAAENAQNRCWNLNGEILETNVRYPR